jgi:hypothetical protein
MGRVVESAACRLEVWVPAIISSPSFAGRSCAPAPGVPHPGDVSVCQCSLPLGTPLLLGQFTRPNRMSVAGHSLQGSQPWPEESCEPNWNLMKSNATGESA